ncbi:fungal-specific transcription factor domain-containing protein [Lineolata rhizophorae]|uniref:Fungal-specific transcription factor domain-containing protein n=1 Tax=Lineolata rhizophorae TaxID=578093 RepID=A0A6A6NNY5_9PEZI|nr:fungal-specific transcription factor domain-containing protein [Lineolata rhizophorae]
MNDGSKAAEAAEANDMVQQGGGSKRRRIALACNACRVKKSRCDGARPKCTLCSDLGFECVYVQSASSSNIIVGKEYLADLENRVQIIEERLKLFPPGSDGQQTPTSSTAAKDTPQLLDLVKPPIATPGEDADEQDMAGTEDPVDAMGAVAFAKEEESAFFGPSSNISFLRHIRRAVERARKTDAPWAPQTPQATQHLDGAIIRSMPPPSSPIAHSKSESISSNQGQLNLYALPPDTHIRALLQSYFNNTGFLFPYLHKETFLQTFEQTRGQNPKSIRKTWLGLLNVVLALATTTKVQLQPEMKAQQRMEESEVFYHRAFGLCQSQMLRGTSVEIVQCLLLMSQYLQGTQKSVQAWTLHGLAIKAAFQLGLHSKEASRAFPPLERELRKRLWFGCVMLDRTHSMTFGRPSTISESCVKLDLPMEFDTILSQGHSLPPMRGPTSLPFFTATIKLYEIMWHIIDRMYGQNVESEKPLEVGDLVSQLVTLEQELLEWRSTLPPSLLLRSAAEVESFQDKDFAELHVRMMERLKIILTLRYLNLQILLHRPILSKFLDCSNQPHFNPQVLSQLVEYGSHNVQKCLGSAMELISIVASTVARIGNCRDLLGAWWFSLYYTFNAALAIFACLLVCRRENQAAPRFSIPEVDARRCLHKSIEALRLLDSGNYMVERCCAYLEQCNSALGSINQSFAAPVPMTASVPRPMSSQDFYATGIAHFGQSPLGMEFGEFMEDSDFNFFNPHFPIDATNAVLPSPR